MVRIETPDPEFAAEAMRLIEEGRAALRFIDTNRERLLEEHGEKWIAVTGDGVLASADSFDDLIRQLSEDGKDGQDAHIEHLTRHPEILILITT